MNKTVYDDVVWACGRVMYITFYDDVFSCLNLSFTTQAASGEVRKESLSVFPNGGMTSSHVSEMGA